jgi:hypothetical protein
MPDITETTLNKKTSKNKQLRDAILNSLSAQIAVIGPDGVIKSVNEAWRLFEHENTLPSTAAGMITSRFSGNMPAGHMVSPMRPMRVYGQYCKVAYLHLRLNIPAIFHQKSDGFS